MLTMTIILVCVGRYATNSTDTIMITCYFRMTYHNWKIITLIDKIITIIIFC
jgi:hypothetical protein